MAELGHVLTMRTVAVCTLALLAPFVPATAEASAGYQVRNAASGHCLTATGHVVPRSAELSFVAAWSCTKPDALDQLWIRTDGRYHPVGDRDRCLAQRSGAPVLAPCDPADASQEWRTVRADQGEWVLASSRHRLSGGSGYYGIALTPDTGQPGRESRWVFDRRATN